ncbi:MAG: hypothetical protein H7070_15815 [Saprospiraceae bacterium]|nr:hypothetical protein [Pyrinomonadaceae bacterium]
MWQSRSKEDLIIEVWEKLDCESVGAAEIAAIEEVLLDRFGKSAVDSPMILARLLADEGAELRHSEIMQLYVERNSNLPYEAEFRNILDISDFKSVLTSIRSLENLRRKYESDGDKEGLRLVLEKGRSGRRSALAIAEDDRKTDGEQLKNAEIAEWLTLWLQSPETFEIWVKLRQSAPGFQKKFATD